MILSCVFSDKTRRMQTAPYPSLQVLLGQEPRVGAAGPGCMHAFKTFRPFLGHCDFLQRLEATVQALI